MDSQDQTNPTTPSGDGSGEMYTCRRCGWPYPGPNPSSKQRQEHKNICGSVEGYTDTKVIIDDEAVSDEEHHSSSDSDDEEKEKTPNPKIEKKIIKESSSSAGGVEEKPNKSEDMFSAATEFSDTGIISPGVTSEVKKVDEKSEVFESPIIVQENDTKDSVPLVKDHDGSHEDKLIDQMELSDTVQDQGEDVHEVSGASDTLLVDKAETLIEDFKDYKTVDSNVSSDDKHGESGSVVDVFEGKPVHEKVHESQTTDHEESAFEENISTDNLSEAQASCDKHPVMTLAELLEAENKQAESDHSVPVLTERAVSDVHRETVVGEGSGKVLTGQDSGVGASFFSSSNSLEGVWGSVSDISDVFGKSEKRFDRSYAFKDPSLEESKEGTVEQKASEVNAVKLNKAKSPKSAATEDAISKVSSWSTSGHIGTVPLRKLMGECKSPNPKSSSSLIKKDEDAGTSNQPRKSNVTQENPEFNQESSAVIKSGEGKIVKKKSKVISKWVKYVCCSSPPITKL